MLEDGFAVSGQFIGTNEVFGEVVFNTASSGYEEVVSDPSYYNQIIVFTSPMIGNYGVNPSHWESECYQARGVICLEMQNSIRDNFFLTELRKQGLGVLVGVDTRRLTIYLRDRGSVWGALVQAQSESEAKAKAFSMIESKIHLPKDWVYQVTRKNIEVLNGASPTGPRIGILDFGVKNNIIRLAQTYSSSVVVFPSRTPAEVIETYHLDGLILSNGPGDPLDVLESPQIIAQFIGRKPIFAICMGHQLLARALGAKTYKLKYGHRGVNHPIQDNLLKRIYVASHNHGYAVDEKTLPSEACVTMKNLNDHTVAGFVILEKKVISVQYHPESCPGPLEARALFKYFFEEMLPS